MIHKSYQVDAFADDIFDGNPECVVILNRMAVGFETWLKNKSYLLFKRVF